MNNTIAAGPYHSLALTNDGRIVEWGDNGYGQIECPIDNPLKGRSSPEHFVAITAGSSSSSSEKSA